MNQIDFYEYSYLNNLPKVIPDLTTQLQQDVTEKQTIQLEYDISSGETEALSSEPDTSDETGRIDSDDSFTEQLTETLLAANPPPVQQVSNPYFVFEAQPGDNNFTLRLNPQDQTILELVYNDSADVLASRAVSEISEVVIYGSDEGDDSLTIDFSLPFWIENGIEYHGGAGQELAINFSGALFSISGGLELVLLDFVRGSASFAIAARTIDVDLDGDENFDLLEASLMTIALSDGNLFIGLGGEDDGLAGSGIGFEVTGAQLCLAFIKPSQADIDAGDGRSYLALKAALGTVSLLGISEFDAEADNLILEINQAFGANGAVDAVALDWTTAFDLDGNETFGEASDLLDPGADLNPQVDLTLDYQGQLLRVKSGFAVAISDTIYLNGEFAFEKSSSPITVTLADDTTTISVEILTIGANAANAFAGFNGPAETEGAMGLLLGGVSFALVLMKVSGAGPGDTRSWTALHAEADSISFIGVDGLSVSLNDFSLDYNGADGQNGSVPNTLAVNFVLTDFDGEPTTSEG